MAIALVNQRLTACARCGVMPRSWTINVRTGQFTLVCETCDDHGTLRDNEGQPKIYKAMGADSVPLAEAMVWPDDMTDWEAVRYAADLEWGRATPGSWLGGGWWRRRWHYLGLRGRIPLGRCGADHSAVRCAVCGAER